MKIKMLKLDEIRIDGGTQFREHINQDWVKDYAECMRNNDKFPPIKATFDGSNYWMYNGFHRYFATTDAGFKEIEVEWIPGTQEDAQDLALSANNKQGYGRSRKTKENAVEFALKQERHAGKSNIQIAILCEVSDTFVAAIRNPEVKKKQADNLKRHFKKKLESEANDVPEMVGSVSLTEPSSLTEPKPSLHNGHEPSEEELRANELSMQADRELLNNLLDSDDALKTAHEELVKLNFMNGQLRARVDALMNEKNEAIAMCKKLQKQLDKVSKK